MVCAEHFGTREVAGSPLWQELLVPWCLRYSMSTLLRMNSRLGALFAGQAELAFVTGIAMEAFVGLLLADVGATGFAVRDWTGASPP